LTIIYSPADNLCQSFSLTGNGCDLSSFTKKKENTHNPHITPALLMDKFTESLTSISLGLHHNYRLGRRVVFHVIRDCLCFCPLGTKEGKHFQELDAKHFSQGNFTQLLAK
jgi:hypothetical protein